MFYLFAGEAGVGGKKGKEIRREWKGERWRGHRKESGLERDVGNVQKINGKESV